MSSAIRSSLGLACLFVLMASGHAQYPPPVPAYPAYPGYYPPPGYGGFGPGNVLNGQANVISAAINAIRRKASNRHHSLNFCRFGARPGVDSFSRSHFSSTNVPMLFAE